MDGCIIHNIHPFIGSGGGNRRRSRSDSFLLIRRKTRLGGIVVVQRSDVKVGVEWILVLRVHVLLDVEIHVLQDMDEGVAQMEHVLARYVSEIAVVQLRDGGHHDGCELLTSLGQIDEVLLAILRLPIVVDEPLLPQDLDDPVGVGGIQIEEAGEADEGLSVSFKAIR